MKIRSEEWFARLYRHLPPAEDSHVHRCGGVEDEFLRQLARPSGKPSVLDPRIPRVSACPACLRRLGEIRSESKHTGAYWTLWGAGFALVATIILIAVTWRPHERRGTAQAAVLTRTIDLTSSAYTRGGPVEVRLATLPRATAKLTLILPVLSEAGVYKVAVSKARGEGRPLLAATGVAYEENRETKLTLVLHLESVAPGLYYLSTSHADSSSYYYPLEIVK